jgi:hypothetical protein
MLPNQCLLSLLRRILKLAGSLERHKEGHRILSLLASELTQGFTLIKQAHPRQLSKLLWTVDLMIAIMLTFPSPSTYGLQEGQIELEGQDQLEATASLHKHKHKHKHDNFHMSWSGDLPADVICCDLISAHITSDLLKLKKDVVVYDESRILLKHSAKIRDLIRNVCKGGVIWWMMIIIP